MFKEIIMGVYELLNEAVDSRKGGNDCDFNGYLEDYLGTIPSEDEVYPLFAALLNADPDLKICVNYGIKLSDNSISNLIIRYKDINKLSEKAFKCPYIIYAKKDDREKAVIMADEYVYAKGLYYCATESNASFEGVKNDLVAIDTNHINEVVELYKKLFNNRAGYLQREVDQKMYENYDAMFKHALDIATKIKDNIFEDLKNTEDKAALIEKTVVSWFLIKKYVYVQYMVDKKILNDVHNGNTKAQRNQAKQNADAIRFISIPELWKGRIGRKQN